MDRWTMVIKLNRDAGAWESGNTDGRRDTEAEWAEINTEEVIETSKLA